MQRAAPVIVRVVVTLFYHLALCLSLPLLPLYCTKTFLSIWRSFFCFWGRDEFAVGTDALPRPVPTVANQQLSDDNRIRCPSHCHEFVAALFRPGLRVGARSAVNGREVSAAVERAGFDMGDAGGDGQAFEPLAAEERKSVNAFKPDRKSVV